MEQQQPEVIIGNAQTQKISAKEFASKYKSKREVYNFLSVDVGVYLPAYGKTNLMTISLTVFLPHRANQHLLPEGHCVQQEEE